MATSMANDATRMTRGEDAALPCNGINHKDRYEVALL